MFTYLYLKETLMTPFLCNGFPRIFSHYFFYILKAIRYIFRTMNMKFRNENEFKSNIDVPN